MICFSFFCCFFSLFLKCLLCVGVCLPTFSLLSFPFPPGLSQPPSEFKHPSTYTGMTNSEPGTALGKHSLWISALFSKQFSPRVHCALSRLCPPMKLAFQMKAISLTCVPMTPQIHICSTEVFRPPFQTAS